MHADRDGSAAVTAAMLSALSLSSPHVRQLREVPAEKLMAAQQQVSLQLMLTGGKHLLPFQPVVDGRVLPRHPLDEVTEGIARDVSLLVGTTLDEWKLFGFMDVELRQLDEARIAARIQQRLAHADGARIEPRATAQRAPRRTARGELGRDRDRPRLPCARDPPRGGAAPRAAGRLHVPLHLGVTSLGGVLGACHAIELPFLFDVLEVPGAENFAGKGPEAKRLAGWTMDAWTAFAHRGDPSDAGLGTWPRYDLARRATMELGARAGVLDDPAADERRLWDGVL